METLRSITFVVCLTMVAAPAWPQSNIEKIKADYKTASAKLENHFAEDGPWIDESPESPGLLAQQWSLAAEWVAAWLNAHPDGGPERIRDALSKLAPSSTPQYLALNPTTFLVVSPSRVGNVFIVSKSGDRYRVAWNIAERQEATGKSAEILAGWRPENAREGARGSGADSGSIDPNRLGIIPGDARGHARFYIEGWYASLTGGTDAVQLSLWVWDGITARLQLARYYFVGLNQKNVGTRMEGDLLKVQQKKHFRTFFSCDPCEERQTDWIVRITPDAMKELGEKSVVPELDAVDELFYRVINGKPASDIASSAAIGAARRIVDCVRGEKSDKEWNEFPSLGMMGEWSLTKDRNAEVLHFETDDIGALIFKLRPAASGFFIPEITECEGSC